LREGEAHKFFNNVSKKTNFGLQEKVDIKG